MATRFWHACSRRDCTRGVVALSIEVSTEDRDDHLLLRCRGTFSIDGLTRALDQALDAGAAAGRRAVLVDIRGLDGMAPNSLERYEIGVRVADRQRAMEETVALVVVGDEPIVDPERFAEVVARNRGAFARVFTDFDEALVWIREEAGRTP